MKEFTLVPLSAIVIILSACATSYQSKGLTGGFSETKLAPDTVQIRFNGNGYTKRERTNDFAMLRAAEVCLESGYNYFVVLSGGTSSDSNTYVSGGGPSYTTGQVTNYGYGNYGYSGTTYRSAPTVNTITRHETALTVKFFKSKPMNGGYDARFITQSIRAKYKI